MTKYLFAFASSCVYLILWAILHLPLSLTTYSLTLNTNMFFTQSIQFCILIFVYIVYRGKKIQSKNLIEVKGFCVYLFRKSYSFLFLLIPAILLFLFNDKLESSLIINMELSPIMLCFFCLIAASNEELFFRAIPCRISEHFQSNKNYDIFIASFFFALPHIYQGELALIYSYVTGVLYMSYYKIGIRLVSHRNVYKKVPLWLQSRLCHLIILHATHNFFAFRLAS